MRNIHKFIIAIAAALFVSSVSMADDKTVTTAKLLGEIIDRESLAIYPSPDYSIKQASSYDRRSVSRDAKDWFANYDFGNFIREEDKDGRHEFVMMDVEGPGAIVRFWVTLAGENGGKGTLRIYIDNMDEPAICGNVFEVLSGGFLTGAPLSDSVSPLTRYASRGHDLYYPILYSKHCKVTYESPWIHATGSDFEWVFYNINYREYAPGTSVVPFSWEDVKKDAPLADKVNEILKKGVDSFCTKNTKSESYEATILPGESVSMKIKGPRAITRLEAMLEATDKEQALRSTIVEIAFDGNSTVWCPFGDFIGIGYRELYTSTWWTKAEDGLCTSLWVMPFKKECEITLHNLGSQVVSLKKGKVVTKSWKWTDRSMYFGSNWSILSRCKAGDNVVLYSQKDVDFTTLKGKGVYVGDAISLFDTSCEWWGEGDEKVYVDGESFPSSFGTGTEDYYGYACCSPDIFTDHPFIAQPCGDGNLAPGYTSNSRYRALDRIPFRTSLDFDLELWHWSDAVITYAPASFWYILPGGECGSPRQVEGAKEKVLRDRSEIFPPRLSMNIEGEDLQIDRVSGGSTGLHSRNEVRWSGRYQLVWFDAPAGATMDISFLSPVEGTFEMSATLTKAPDYGIVGIELNGKTLAEGLDLNATELRTGKFELGVQKVRKGLNVMTVRAISPAPGLETCIMGIDKLDFIFTDK